MKNVGIITICDNDNYGNRLQNYALHETLNKLGIKNTTFWPEWAEDKTTLERKIKIAIKSILNMYDIKAKRYLIFKQFTDSKIDNQYINFENLDKISNEFDYFIVGSDQIWNYNFGLAQDKDFLKFTDYDKRISYAPSFGISDIEEKWKAKICNGVNSIKYLSVRENQGAKIIKELTGRNAKVLLDPSLLLSKEEWRKVQKKPKRMKFKKYILTYFLGEKSKELQLEINSLKERDDLEVINLCDINEEQYYAYGPSEFLYLFDNAELILTDSFHACVFSIIYNKSFFVFDRKQKNMKNMNSRLDTLLEIFKLQERKVKSLEGKKDIYECDYSKSYEILKIKQNESLDFLKKSMNISQYNRSVANE